MPLRRVIAGVKDLRDGASSAARAPLASGGQRTVLFIDEIHRFNKAQQDALLPDVEDGTVTLVGGTTENPFFAVNSPLLSPRRCFTLEPLGDADDRRAAATGRWPTRSAASAVAADLATDAAGAPGRAMPAATPGRALERAARGGRCASAEPDADGAAESTWRAIERRVQRAARAPTTGPATSTTT